ncbi:MAG: pyridoxamine 5'-phosphate oxidase family protein [Patescibacteria group bacterium]
MDLRSLITEYLSKATLMQVATSRDDKPWVCSVYFAFDDKRNLYWISSTQRRHSQELRNNEHVAGAIVLPHTMGDKVRGLQFEGIAKEITDQKSAADAMQWYAKRFGLPEDRVKRIVENTDGHVVYMITPSSYVLFDEVNFPDNPRQEYAV